MGQYWCNSVRFSSNSVLNFPITTTTQWVLKYLNKEFDVFMVEYFWIDILNPIFLLSRWIGLKKLELSLSEKENGSLYEQFFQEETFYFLSFQLNISKMSMKIFKTFYSNLKGGFKFFSFISKKKYFYT